MGLLYRIGERGTKRVEGVKHTGHAEHLDGVMRCIERRKWFLLSCDEIAEDEV